MNANNTNNIAATLKFTAAEAANAIAALVKSRPGFDSANYYDATSYYRDTKRVQRQKAPALAACRALAAHGSAALELPTNAQGFASVGWNDCELIRDAAGVLKAFYDARGYYAVEYRRRALAAAEGLAERFALAAKA